MFAVVKMFLDGSACPREATAARWPKRTFRENLRQGVGELVASEQIMRRCVNAYPSSSRKPHKESQLRENHSTDRARAEALFKKEKQMRKGAKAMAEYEVSLLNQ